MSKRSVIDEEFVSYIFESEHNRKVFREYLKKYFSGLGDKFWSKYYINCYNPSTGYINMKPDEDKFRFAFTKQAGSNYTSPIIDVNRKNNVVSIARDFNKMQHYRCEEFTVENISRMYMEFKRENAINKLLQ